MRRRTEPPHRATLGIIGSGRISTAVAMRNSLLGLNVIFYDSFLPDSLDKALGVKRATLIELLARRHYHLPYALTDGTRRMADETFFNRMTPGVMFLHIARGGIVVLEALAPALREDRLPYAGLDVLANEPSAPDHPLKHAWRADEPWLRVRGRPLITSHAAFYPEEAYAELHHQAALEARRVLHDETSR